MHTYAELHCLSNFSFLRGASHPEELVARAASLGYTALAITDECSLAGIVRAHTAAREHRTRLIAGTEIRLDDGPKLVLLAESRDGYGRLCELISQGRQRVKKGRYRLLRADIAAGMKGCLALLIPGDSDGTGDAAWLASVLPGRAWIAVELHRGQNDGARLAMLRQMSRASGLPLVAAGDVHMHVRQRRILQDMLTAIRLGTGVAEAGYALFANGERHLRSRQNLAHIYPDDLLAESVRIADRCRFSLDELSYNYPGNVAPSGTSPTDHLRHLARAGMHERWPAGVPEKVATLVEYELAIIAELGYEPYFLVVHDIVRFARKRGILCQGRGSAANSAVCYCLGITAVDPSRMEMLFERFVSRERNEPPDIDIDFEHERREEVLQYIYDKYGRDHAALAATVITYRRRSALRDAGKALGIDAAQLQRISRAMAWWDSAEKAVERIAEAGLDPENPSIRRLLRLAGEMAGFPRHLSQHVGGMVITRDPLCRLVPIENAAMTGRSVIQWDKNDLDAMGMLKVDCLALGMLSAIRRAFDLVSRHRGRCLSLANIPAEDADVYAMMSRADTVGVFQIESRAQMAMLPRLRPRNFYDLVIEIAIIRPGPIQGQMVHPYLKRRHGLEAATYPSEEVREVLARTLGVPIFQEQVIKLAMVAAGFSAGMADQLRRALAAWGRSGHLMQFERRLIDGMRERGYSEDFARRIFAQIRGFGEYGFPESHAASFALLAYASAWLKCHEPAVFTCALINSQPMGFYAPAQLVRDAREHGVEIHPVDACTSDWDCSLEPAGGGSLALRLGLRLVKGLSRSGADRLLQARSLGMFSGIHDLIERSGLGRRDRQALASAGALERLAGNRHQAHWQILGYEEALPLPFRQVLEPVPMLPAPDEADRTIADYASLGLTLGRHPLALLRSRLADLRLAPLADIRGRADGECVRICGLIITRQRPSSASGVVFLTLEDETGMANIIVWPSLLERYRHIVLTSRLLAVTGRISREGEVIHVLASRLVDHSALIARLATSSRDFC